MIDFYAYGKCWFDLRAERHSIDLGPGILGKNLPKATKGAFLFISTGLGKFDHRNPSKNEGGKNGKRRRSRRFPFFPPCKCAPGWRLLSLSKYRGCRDLISHSFFKNVQQQGRTIDLQPLL
jgi:hypothetical protein